MIRCSSCRTGRTSSASSASSSHRAGRCSRATSGRSTTSSSASRAQAAPATPVATDAQRQLIIRTAVSATSLNGLGASSRFTGFADALGTALAELESGLVEPADLRGDLALLYAAYRAELDKLGLWDRDLLRRHAADRVAGELDAWSGRPVFAYGFEDLTGAQWALLEALAGRTEVTVSLPYEPNRAPFESLARTSRDLSSLADGRIEELGPRYGEVAPPELAHLERHLFADDPPPAPPLEGSIRFLEGAGARGTLELVADEALKLIRGGTRPEEILIVCPSVDRQRAQLETALTRSRCRTRSRGASGSARRRSARRSSRSCASSGARAGATTCTASSARRSPA